VFKKNIANLITLTRLIGSLFLISFNAYSKEFFVIYSYCGLSDILDGILARSMHLESELGSKLDSLADIVFFLVTLFKIGNRLFNQLPKVLIIIIVCLFIIRILLLIKSGKFFIEHTILNKVTGALLFLIPYILNTNYFIYYSTVVIILAIFSTIYDFQY